jgi:hypothetical protein
MAFDKKILSIDSDDDNKDYDVFNEFLEDDTRRKKNKTASFIEEIGEQCLTEMGSKKKRKLQIAYIDYIPYIIKYCNDRYSEDELKSYSFEDIQGIYKEIKAERRPAIVKFFHFLFNL